MTAHPIPHDRPTRTRGHDPAYQAFLLLRAAFTVAPIVFGLDKFFNLLPDAVGFRPGAPGPARPEPAPIPTHSPPNGGKEQH